MIEDKIVKLLMDKGLGSVRLPISPVPGGFLHRMYKVDTETGSFAVKHLNPNIMRRPEAMDNFKAAEALERMLDTSDIPIVPALEFDGCKMQLVDGDYFYIFKWQEGAISEWNNISAEQCRIAGSIQGKIHAIASMQVDKPMPEFSCIDWDDLLEKAASNAPTLEGLIKENKEMFIYAEKELNSARANLPGIESIVDEDMDPKNVMWHEGHPKVIDLECLERGNPVSSAIQLSLQWAGATICDLDFSKMKAFFDGYLDAYDSGLSDYSSVFGLAYTWVEWLEYNIRRALGHCADEGEREIGLSEVELSVARIRYLKDMEGQILQNLKCWFG